MAFFLTFRFNGKGNTHTHTQRDNSQDDIAACTFTGASHKTTTQFARITSHSILQ